MKDVEGRIKYRAAVAAGTADIPGVPAADDATAAAAAGIAGVSGMARSLALYGSVVVSGVFMP